MADESTPRYNFSDPNAPKPVIPAASSSPHAQSTNNTRSSGSTARGTSSFDDQAPPIRLLVGLVAGVGTGLLCAWLYALFVSATGFGFSLITGGIGWLIGLAVLVAGGRTGLAPAVMSVGVTFVSLCVSRYLLVGMEIDKLIQQGRFPQEARMAIQSDPIGITFKSFSWSPMSIVVLLIGVYGAWKLTYQAGETVAE